jgi:hypothetical protein
MYLSIFSRKTGNGSCSIACRQPSPGAGEKAAATLDASWLPEVEENGSLALSNLLVGRSDDWRLFYLEIFC